MSRVHDTPRNLTTEGRVNILAAEKPGLPLSKQRFNNRIACVPNNAGEKIGARMNCEMGSQVRPPVPSSPEILGKSEFGGIKMFGRLLG